MADTYDPSNYYNPDDLAAYLGSMRGDITQDNGITNVPGFTNISSVADNSNMFDVRSDEQRFLDDLAEEEEIMALSEDQKAKATQQASIRKIEIDNIHTVAEARDVYDRAIIEAERSISTGSQVIREEAGLNSSEDLMMYAMKMDANWKSPDSTYSRLYANHQSILLDVGRKEKVMMDDHLDAKLYIRQIENKIQELQKTEQATDVLTAIEESARLREGLTGEFYEKDLTRELTTIRARTDLKEELADKYLTTQLDRADAKLMSSLITEKEFEDVNYETDLAKENETLANRLLTQHRVNQEIAAEEFALEMAELKKTTAYRNKVAQEGKDRADLRTARAAAGINDKEMDVIRSITPGPVTVETLTGMTPENRWYVQATSRDRMPDISEVILKGDGSALETHIANLKANNKLAEVELAEQAIGWRNEANKAYGITTLTVKEKKDYKDDGLTAKELITELENKKLAARYDVITDNLDGFKKHKAKPNALTLPSTPEYDAQEVEASGILAGHLSAEMEKDNKRSLIGIESNQAIKYMRIATTRYKYSIKDKPHLHTVNLEILKRNMLRQLMQTHEDKYGSTVGSFILKRDLAPWGVLPR